MGKLADQIKIGFKKNWWLQKRNKGAMIIILVLPLFMAAAAGFSMRAGLGSVKRTLIPTQSYASEIFTTISALDNCISANNMTSCTIAVLARPLGSSNRTDTIINNFKSLVRYEKTPLPVQYVQSQDEMLQGYANNTVWAGIELEELKEGFNYTIRLAEDDLPGSTDSDEMFLTSGFVGLQSLLERAILMTTVPSHNVTSYYAVSKYPYWKQDKPPKSLANSFASMINYSYMLAFLVPLVQIVKEKQSKLKEFMKIAGLNEIAYWLSWLCMQLVFVVGPLVLSSCSIYLVLGSELQTPFFAFFLLNAGYVVASIMFSFLVPVIMTSAQLASITATLWFTILGMVSSFLLDASFGVQLGTAFIAPMGFYCALMKVFVNEATNSPWASVWFSTEEMTTGNFAAVLFIDAIIYTFLVWYLSNVLPQDQGIRKPFYFCFLPRYWRATPKQLAEEESLLLNENDNDYELREGIEQLNSSQPVGIQIRKLNKIYPGKQDEKVVAVNNLSMDIGTNQIMALLGHNGAGKSTTISVLTGMTSATSGEVLINGLDINENIDTLRKVMGYCPQKDLLFDELTGDQHLRIFAKLRGVDDDVLDHVVMRALENVDLVEKKDTIVKEYSGGMKRRLSLAIATIGPVRVVFLDEPTSGLDPTSRAHLWDSLKKFKEGKTIILTTHFMEEADVLGDRIAIIANGKLKCYGTPLFLKQRFGIGYYLNIAKAEFFSMSNFTKFIKELYPTASLAQENDGDMTILLPNSESSLLLNLLKALEQETKEPVHNLGIESYGISMTSLEDVFLKITADETEHTDEPKPSQGRGEHSINVDEDEVDHVAGTAAALDAAEDAKASSFVTKMNALVKARVIFQLRSWKMLLVFLLLPTLTLLLMNLIFTTQQNLNNNQINSKTDAVPESFSFVEFLPVTFPFSQLYYGTRPDIRTFLNATHSLSSNPEDIKFLEFQTYHDIENYLTDQLNSSSSVTIDPRFSFGALSFNGINATSNYYYMNFYYNQLRHGSLPALINMFHSAILALNASPEVARTFLKVNSNPFPQASGNIFVIIRESTNAYLIAIELCALGVLLAKKILSERLHQTRLLINVTGTPPFIYWISNLIVDGTLTFISVFMACVVGFIVQMGGLTVDLLPSVALVALGFTLSYTSWAYICTYMFNKVETLQKWLGLINMVTVLPAGLLFAPAPFNLLANLTPSSAVATAFVHLATLKDQARVYNQGNYFAFLDPNLGICWSLLFFLGQSLLFFAILVIVDSLHNYHRKQSLYDDSLPPRDDIDMDDDVRQEKDRVWNDQHNPKDVVKALNIYKVYNKDVTAVKGVTMGMQNNLCFGLLGPNGAGKTTTIAMLTAQMSTSHGDILLHNMSTHNISVSKLYRQIALNCCLQSNKALMGFLTVREQLELYVKLRAGLTPAQVSHHVTTLLHRTGLSKYENKLTKTLSGGNKRKLSLAIAMAWGSKIILLDEPSSGMDPLARRQLWHEIRYVKNNNTCVLLTTHSMDEAEAICDRIAIMVKGQIRCIGSPQHLKHKFGSGYRLLLTYSQDKQVEVHNFVTSHFAGCKLLEAMDGFRMYDVGAVGNNLAALFALVEENKHELSISNWAISQTSLKQVFLHLTKQQNENQPLFS